MKTNTLIRFIDGALARIIQLVEISRVDTDFMHSSSYSQQVLKDLTLAKTSDGLPNLALRINLLRKISRLPGNPLQDQAPNDISVLLPVGPNDIEKFVRSLNSILENSMNRIVEILIVTPQASKSGVSCHLSNFSPTQQVVVRIVTDEDLIPPEIMSIINDHFPANRHAWYKQQVIKWLGAIILSTDDVLLMDSDTEFTRPRCWSSYGQQILMPVYEHHTAYFEHIRAMWNGRVDPLPVSFISHHQLVQKSVLESMFAEFGGVIKGIAHWLHQIRGESLSLASEYETYAVWLIRNFPDRVVLAKWGNFVDSRIVIGLRRFGFSFRSVWSISRHSFRKY